jgi:hypothetical protein
MKYEDTPLAKLVKKLQEMPPPSDPQDAWEGEKEQKVHEHEYLHVGNPQANKLAVFRHEGHIVLEPRQDDMTLVSVTMSKAEALMLAQSVLEVETAVREERPVDAKFEDGFLLVINDVEQEGGGYDE